MHQDIIFNEICYMFLPCCVTHHLGGTLVFSRSGRLSVAIFGEVVDTSLVEGHSP